MRVGGRYQLVERVGEGGMGVVHEAHDLELDRVVAVKQIRRRRSKSMHARVRLRREAAAMAQLSHPNVVRVFDVVEDDGRIFVVMEFVDRDTLDVHLTRAGVDWRTLVPLFIGIGRGLAAIHARGLVHRDFKPANVLIADDGVPRVSDFGLVQFPGESSSSTSGEERDARDLPGVGERFLSPLTAPGMVAGTPKYMPPEQQEGKRVDAKADQYAYCLSFWEALAGHLPFRETDAARMLEAKKAGVPAGERVPAPAAVVDVLRRGLDPDPAKRWPSMQHLIDALERTQRRRPQVWWLLPPVAICLAVLALGWQDEGTGCRDPGDAMVDVWGPSDHEALAVALRNARPRVTATTQMQLLEAVDGWAARWLSAYAEACATATGTERDGVLACLRRQRAQLEGTVDVLSTDDPAVLGRGLELMAGLPRVESCLEHDGGDSVPEGGRAVLIERAVARAEAFVRAGKHAEALDAAEGVLANLSCGEYPEHCGRLRMVDGRAYAEAGRFEDSSRSFEEAYATAVRAGDDNAAAWAALALAFNASSYDVDLSAARRWLEHAESLAGRLEGDSAELRAAALSTRARLDVQSNRGQEGLADAEAAVSVCLERRLGDAVCSRHLTTLGWVLSNLGAYERAEEVQRRTIDALVQEVGADHQRTAQQYGALAVTLEQLGKDADVLPLVEKELEIYRRVNGDEHVRTLSAKLKLAKHLTDREEPQRARKMVDEVVELCERAAEVPDYVQADALTIGAYIDSSRGLHRDARKQLLLVLEITAGIVGADHPANGPQLRTLATEERELGRYDRAAEALQRAEKVTTNPTFRAMVLRDWARLNLERGLVEDAAAMLQRAEALWGERGSVDVQVAAQRAELHGRLALARGEAAAAVDWFRDAMELCEAGTLAHPTLRLRYALGYARAALVAGDNAGAVQVLDEARAWATEQRAPQQRAEYEFVRAQALWSTKRSEARRHLARAQELIQSAEGGHALRAEITTWAQ